MTHLPFIAGAYGAFLLVGLSLSLATATRLRRARAKLRALDTRGRA